MFESHLPDLCIEEEGGGFLLSTPVPMKRSPALPTDTELLNHLQELISECPHAEIVHNLDEDHEEFPLGWTIRIVGCEASHVTAPTFREAIAADMDFHRRWMAHGGPPPPEPPIKNPPLATL